MEQLTGYEAGALLGRNLRLLQADDHDQEGLRKIRDALRDGSSCQTTLRNYRRDGTMFWNEVTLAPLRDASGQITHFASFHRDVAEKMRLDGRGEGRDPSMNTQTMLAYLRDDKLTGLLRRPYFEELVKRDWGLAQRESRRLSILVFDLDHYSQYRDVFGKGGADQSFRRIARVIGACFRRASDLCGRFDDDQVAALTTGLDLVQASKLARSRARPRAGSGRSPSALSGVALRHCKRGRSVACFPPHDADPARAYEAALKALKDAKELGRNRVVSREGEWRATPVKL